MPRPQTRFLGSLLLGAQLLCSAEPAAQSQQLGVEREPLKVLFLGDRGHHKPAERAPQLIPYLLHRGIKVHYTESTQDLTPRNLEGYDAVMVYANIAEITAEAAGALVAYVESGGGYVPLHCASFCFNNSPKMIALTGAQFRRHKTGTFKTTIVAPEHPIMQGFQAFESWDETYVHHKHNSTNRTVLSRRQTDGEDEPWTWVRSQGKGRVFYTAWGHDRRTWSKPGFKELMERGIRWASGDDKPAETIRERPMLKPFAFEKAKVAYYPPGGKGKGAGDWPKMQLPLKAKNSAKHIITPAGFRAELFAAEPDIRPAIAMAWDTRGRLWICESVDYPNRRQEAGEGNDTIKICEDSDGDGRADKFTVFADKLSIPTSLCFANGGIIVQQAPNTLFLKDLDGDDVADVHEVLIRGWSTGDTHAGPSNLQYGLDNQIWGMIGYAGFKGEVGGEALRFGQGFYRMRPDGSKLEFVRSTNNNTWGLGFTEDGLVFGSTANGNPSCYMPIANRYYAKAEGMKAKTLGRSADSYRFLPITERIRQVDVHGGYTSAAGHAVYTARSYPASYWNRRAFVTGPTGKLIGVFDIERDGADVKTRNHFNLLSSDDEWTGPIMAEVGPDGQVWVIDFYNYIIQHNPTPAEHEKGEGNAYITPLRDKLHARIYRVVYEGVETTAAMDLSTASTTELVAALGHDNMLWRKHAQRLLVESGKQVLEQGLEQGLEQSLEQKLIRLCADKTVDTTGLNAGAIHALWTLHGLGFVTAAHPQALHAAQDSLRHPSAGVRRNALAVLPHTQASVTAILAAGCLNDENAQVRLAALLALSEMPPSNAAGAMIYAIVAEERNHADRWIADAAAIAGSTHHAGFVAAAKPTENLTQPEPTGPNLIPNPSFEDVDASMPVGWKIRTYSGSADHALADHGRTGRHSLRISSTKGSDTSWHATIKLKAHTRYRMSGWIKTDALTPKGNAHGSLFNIHEINPSTTTSQKGTTDWQEVTGTFENDGRTEFTVNCLFGGWGHSTGTAWFDDLQLIELGPASAGGRGAEGITAIVVQHAKAIGSGTPIRVAVDPASLSKGGDATRGKRLFFSHEIAGCFRCHQVAGKGGVIAPKLDGIGAQQSSAYLVESLLDPNAVIAKNYPGKISPMPPMRAMLSDSEIKDLVAYLQSLR